MTTRRTSDIRRSRAGLPCGVLLAWLVLAGTARAQDPYDRGRTLSSEDLFMQRDNRLLAKAGERYLALDTSPLLGGYRRYRFFPGDQVRFRLRGRRTRFNEEIYTVTDSSFTFSFINEAAGIMETREVLLADVRKIKLFRRIPWVTEAAPLLPLAGLVYLGADFFNRGIDGQRFTTDTGTLVVTGSFLAGGYLCYRLSFPSVRINDRSRLKVLQTY